MAQRVPTMGRVVQDLISKIRNDEVIAEEIPVLHMERWKIDVGDLRFVVENEQSSRLDLFVMDLNEKLSPCIGTFTDHDLPLKILMDAIIAQARRKQKQEQREEPESNTGVEQGEAAQQIAQRYFSQ